MPHFDKHFTVEEANELIPRIQEIFRRVHGIFQQTDIIKIASDSSPMPLSHGKTNGKQRNTEEEQKKHLAVINSLITELTDQGIVIQDAVRGLVDFPAFIGGDEVFLCYELTDGDRVKFYHDINVGFGGRKPIPE